MLRRTLAAVALVAAGIFGTAGAAGASLAQAAPAVEPFQLITLSELGVTFLISALLPIITGIVTKVGASATVKQLVSITVSAIHGLVTANVIAGGGAIITKEALTFAALSWVIQATTYLNIYKPHDANAKLAPNLGVG